VLARADASSGIRLITKRDRLCHQSGMRVLAVALVSLLPCATLAQTAGGYSAGPAQTAPTYQALPGPDGGVPGEAPTRDDNGVDYATRVISYEPSPVYSQNREFTNARLWVLDPGKYVVEQWWTGSFGSPRANPSAYPNGQFFQTEIEMGIAPHVQVDIYANYEFGQNSTGTYVVAPGGHTGIAAEVRFALGNYWGQIWGNPTLYFELTSQYYNSPRAEFRLLMGGTVFTPKLLAAFNLGFERNIFRDNISGIDYELKGDFGINYELVPKIFRVGLEATLGFDSHGTIDAQGNSLLHYVAQFGPSILLTDPHNRVKLLAALLHGFAAWDQPWVVSVIAGVNF
jgi:hypothetical protein